MPVHQFKSSLNSLGAVLSSTLSQQQLVSDQKAMELLEFHKKLKDQHQARRCTALGLDHVLCFDRVDKALTSALHLQLAFPELKIGLHLGDVRFTKSDVFGAAVEGAMMLSEAAECGEILVSLDVVNQLPTDRVNMLPADNLNQIFSIRPPLQYSERQAS